MEKHPLGIQFHKTAVVLSVIRDNSHTDRIGNWMYILNALQMILQQKFIGWQGESIVRDQELI